MTQNQRDKGSDDNETRGSHINKVLDGSSNAEEKDRRKSLKILLLIISFIPLNLVFFFHSFKQIFIIINKGLLNSLHITLHVPIIFSYASDFILISSLIHALEEETSVIIPLFEPINSRLLFDNSSLAIFLFSISINSLSSRTLLIAF